jgi:hypothetical protein
MTTRKRIKPETKKAMALSKAFYGFDPRYLKRRNLTWPKSLVLLGACPQVDYISDKFDGKKRQYYHEFVHPTLIFAGPKAQKNGDNVLIIIGKFEITEDGIVG